MPHVLDDAWRGPPPPSPPSRAAVRFATAGVAATMVRPPPRSDRLKVHQTEADGTSPNSHDAISQVYWDGRVERLDQSRTQRNRMMAATTPITELHAEPATAHDDTTRRRHDGGPDEHARDVRVDSGNSTPSSGFGVIEPLRGSRPTKARSSGPAQHSPAQGCTMQLPRARVCCAGSPRRDMMPTMPRMTPAGEHTAPTAQEHAPRHQGTGQADVSHTTQDHSLHAELMCQVSTDLQPRTDFRARPPSKTSVDPSRARVARERSGRPSAAGGQFPMETAPHQHQQHSRAAHDNNKTDSSASDSWCLQQQCSSRAAVLRCEADPALSQAVEK